MEEKSTIHYYLSPKGENPMRVAKDTIKHRYRKIVSLKADNTIYTDHYVSIFECKGDGCEYEILNLGGQDFLYGENENRNILIDITQNWRKIDKDRFEHLKLNI
jgi:hypothetical protein